MVSDIEKQIKLASCPCSDRGTKSCVSLFTAGEIIDIRLNRKNLGYTEEKKQRIIELTLALEAQRVSGSKRLLLNVIGKSVCSQGYSQVCGISVTSGLSQKCSIQFSDVRLQYHEPLQSFGEARMLRWGKLADQDSQREHLSTVDRLSGATPGSSTTGQQ